MQLVAVPRKSHTLSQWLEAEAAQDTTYSGPRQLQQQAAARFGSVFACMSSVLALQRFLRSMVSARAPPLTTPDQRELAQTVLDAQFWQRLQVLAELAAPFNQVSTPLQPPV